MTITPSPDPTLPWAASVIIRTEVGFTAHGTGLPGGEDYDELGAQQVAVRKVLDGYRSLD